MNYKLYPPFLKVPEEEDFSDVWESFCFKLLCLERSQNNIHRRNPPEQGVDIFDSTDKIAYQCKSVESGKSGDFNVTQAINSLKSALAIKSQLGWKDYVLCTNVLVSGTSEKKLKEVYPDIIIKSKNNWDLLCEKYNTEVERNFNILIEIPSQKLLSSVKESFLDHYTDKLLSKLNNKEIEIFLYSNRYESIYKIQVSPEFTIKDLLNIIRGFFKFPESRELIYDDIRVSLKHSIVFNKRKQTLSKTLGEIGITQGDVITYWTTIVWEDQYKFRSDVINNLTLNRLNKSERKDKAIELYKKEIKKRMIEIDSNLTNNQDK
ncbi:ubiquitin family protein [Ornithinibacillus californiensis]|uniref:hypothetical protein n=1 Tax=Ornithinibacillus californiensis TaxID=161536 RepID=UPI00064DB620|nr:hypothetical protein [Ornithinibacillus californiensis]